MTMRTTALTDPVAALVDALPDPVLVVGPDMRVVAVNTAAAKLLPAVRKNDLLVRGLRAPDVLDAVARVLNTGQAQAAIWLDRFPSSGITKFISRRRGSPTIWPASSRCTT